MPNLELCVDNSETYVEPDRRFLAVNLRLIQEAYYAAITLDNHLTKFGEEHARRKLNQGIDRFKELSVPERVVLINRLYRLSHQIDYPIAVAFYRNAARYFLDLVPVRVIDGGLMPLYRLILQAER